MDLSNKLITVANNTSKVFNKGYEQGIEKLKQNPLAYAKALDFAWAKTEFPKGFNMLVHFKNQCTLSSAFIQTKGLEIAKLIMDTPCQMAFNAMFRESADLVLLDITEFPCLPTSLSYFLYSLPKFKTLLGVLDASYCTSAISAFSGLPLLEDINFKPKSMKIDFSFQGSPKLTKPSLLSILNGLYNYKIDLDVTEDGPEFETPNGEIVPGVCKIVEQEIFNKDTSLEQVYCNTDWGYTFTLTKSRYSGNWDLLLEATQEGNYFDFSCYYDSQNKIIFDYCFIKSNPANETHTLNLGATNLAKLSEEEQKIATDKGWVLK